MRMKGLLVTLRRFPIGGAQQLVDLKAHPRGGLGVGADGETPAPGQVHCARDVVMVVMGQHDALQRLVRQLRGQPLLLLGLEEQFLCMRDDNFVTAAATCGGTDFRSSVTGRGESATIFMMICCAVPPRCGGSPDSISYSTLASEYTSLRAESSFSAVACSGLM